MTIETHRRYMPRSHLNHLTHCGQGKMVANFQTTLSNFKIYFNENVWILINISLKFVPRGPINHIPTSVQVMAWRRQAILNQWWLDYRRIYASLGPNELTWACKLINPTKAKQKSNGMPHILFLESVWK